MSSFASAASPEVTLVSKEGEEIKTTLEVAKLSGMIAGALSEEDCDMVVPVPMVDKDSLLKFISFGNYYCTDRMKEFAKVRVLLLL
jgi:hypothetical protein